MHQENVLFWIPLPSFLKDYKETVFKKLDLYEQNILTICQTLDSLFQKQPEIFNTITVIVLTVLVVRMVLSLLKWYRLPGRVKIGTELVHLRKQLEKARADLATVRKHLTEKGENLNKPAVEKQVKNGPTADFSQKIQRLNSDNKQLLAVINRYASCVESTNKFNHFFLNQFTHIISELMKVRSQLARPSSKSLNKTQTNKSIISDLAKEDVSFQQMKSLNTSSALSMKPALTRHESHNTNGNYSDKLLHSEYVSNTPIETPQESPIETPKKIEQQVVLNSEEKSRMKILDQGSEAKSVGNKRLPPPPGAKGPAKIPKPVPRMGPPVVTPTIAEDTIVEKVQAEKQEKFLKQNITIEDERVEQHVSQKQEVVQPELIEPVVIEPVHAAKPVVVEPLHLKAESVEPIGQERVEQPAEPPKPEPVRDTPVVVPPIAKRSTLPPPPSQLTLNRPTSINRPAPPKRPQQKMPVINPLPVPVEQPKQEPKQEPAQSQISQPIKEPQVVAKQPETKEDKPVEMPLQRPKMIPPPPGANRKVPPPPVRRG